MSWALQGLENFLTFLVTMRLPSSWKTFRTERSKPWIRTTIIRKRITGDPECVIKIYPRPFVARLITTLRTVAQQFAAKMAGNVDDREGAEKESQMTLGGTTKVFSWHEIFGGRTEKRGTEIHAVSWRTGCFITGLKTRQTKGIKAGLSTLSGDVRY